MTTEGHVDDAGAGHAEKLHVHPVEDGGWTWRYVDGSGMELLSNTIFSTSEMAADSARRAYPDVELADQEPSRSPPGGEGASSS